MALRQVELDKFLSVSFPCRLNKPLLVNIRGCNGSGKSTIPIMMMNTDPYAFEVVWYRNNKKRVICTVFPSYEFLAIGHYHSKCGGMDSIKDTQEVKDSVQALWNCKMNILMEGIMASTVYKTYADLFSELNNTNSRKVLVFNLVPPLSTCLDRIQSRNGGKPIKSELVEGKWKTVCRNHEKFSDAGFTSIKADNSEIHIGDTLSWFFEKINFRTDTFTDKMIRASTAVDSIEYTDKNGKMKRIRSLPKFTGTPEPIYIPTKEDTEGYEWSKYYKKPNKNMVINWDNMRLYWYWITERMRIWHRRTILREPFPWTEDKILQENKFTNCFRDLDRGTLVYIREILRKLDEPCEDLTKRIKEVILNTQVYRMFLKYSTWEKIGFLYLDTYEEQWEQAKEKLRTAKANGEVIWHAAYFVTDLKAANPNPKTNHDKLENALCLCEMFYEYLDDTYEYVISHDMKDCLEHLGHFPEIKGFSVYEWLCDWGMAYRYVKNYFVNWTDDSYVNVGPGNRMGMDLIFEDKGGLDYPELNFYLRASWKHYMKRYGYYDEFISLIPKWMNGSVTVRTIEHDICETQKYLNIYYGIGRTKSKFKNESRNNLDSLVL